MTMDGTPVQPVEPVSTTEQASAPVATTAPVETKPVEPAKSVTLDEAKLQQMIVEAAEKAAIKAATEAKEIGKRELQSAQDRNKAELQKAQRRAQLAESTLGAARKRVEQLDPEIAKELELVSYREKDKGLTVAEQEESAIRAQQEFHQRFQDGLTQFIKTSGIDPTDKRIDWATDAPNYLEAQTRVLNSVSKIQQENAQTIQAGLEKRLKDMEAKLSKVNVEANSVSTATSQGVVAGSDEEFVKKFASGDLPTTKENVARLKKIQASY